jgi:hypothetical protein
MIPTDRPLRRRSALRIVFLCALALAAGGSAALSTGGSRAQSGTIRFGIQDDAWLIHGAGSLDSRLETIAALGAEIVRLNLHWNEIAPTKPSDPTSAEDPAYDWSGYDEVLNGLHERGVDVLVGIVGAPRWTNGGRGPNWAPRSGSSIAGFARAAAARYPWLKRWLIWNEPNQAIWLRPTRPAIYVSRLLNPAYAALHQSIPGVQVGGGVTAPRGATGGVSPIDWIHGMRAAHARLDAYAHNPYPLDPRHESPRTGGCGHCKTLSMATIQRLLTEVTRSFGQARIWLSEYGYQTNPPDRRLGISPTLQARYLADGAYQAARTARVDILIHYLVRDEPTIGRFQSGLETLAGRRKPSYASFQLPLVEVSRSGANVVLWGQLRAPAAGSSYRLEQVSPSRRWLTGTLTAGAGETFTWHGSLAGGAQVRIVAGALVSPPLSIR